MKEYKRKLAVKLTKSEILEKSKLLSSLEKKKREVQEQKKSIVSKFNAQLKEIGVKMSEASDCVWSEEEMRSVECVDDPDYVTGKVYTRRLDTQEIVAERNIENSDR